MEIIKKFIPNKILKALRPIYHGIVAVIANFYFGKPSEKMVVIGVTGTNGKTTTVNLIAKILEEAGKKVGFVSTANLKIDKNEYLNPKKITMPSGWFLHKALSKMLNNGFQYAVIEVSSEGLAQNRHLGINFDVAVFTNLTPEHLEAHGGFENYKKAKGKLFQTINNSQLTVHKRKIYPDIKQTIIVNADDTHAEYFKSFKADNILSFGVINKTSDFVATNINYSSRGIGFRLSAFNFQLSLKGQFDVYNSLAAIAVTQSLGITLEVCKVALGKIKVIPGRVEVLKEKPFCVVVDYAYEPEEMKQLYETVSRWGHNKVLQVLGPCGGGRDKARIKILGEMAGKFAQEVFITTDDPYDDDPEEIGKIMYEEVKKNLTGAIMELDRRKAIVFALGKAGYGDLVLITGKGADQSMALANGIYIPWDDRKVVLEELSKIK